ncbi:hypothetical protein APHNP_0214 [Anaplasma phagocytophilum str. ApNP]|uniref:Uncharacterized protein n=1 Tax=Anaplasma phagocytophilum str. ApNP TaxID=1359153 RepID=A0A0F3NI02_ANAPH|nr:hypothetical protein APHNP_0214 [Anaplasma phagocytophilum str. ApNP]
MSIATTGKLLSCAFAAFCHDYAETFIIACVESLWFCMFSLGILEATLLS